MVAAGESVDRLTREGHAEFSAYPGCTPLALVAWYIPNASLAADVTQGLLSMRANMNAEAYEARSPLVWAAAGAARDPDLCNLLLEQGMPLDKPDLYGFTPLAAACNECASGTFFLKPEKARYLIDRGANPNHIVSASTSRHRTRPAKSPPKRRAVQEHSQSSLTSKHSGPIHPLALSFGIARTN